MKTGRQAVRLGPADFLGGWRIRREITDFRTGQSGWLEGRATFIAGDDGLCYHETGTLRLAGGPPLQAERRYIWRFAGGRVHVSHVDDSPFHSFVPHGTVAATTHLCGQDTYRGAYDLDGFPDWQVTWAVNGPRKDYVSVTRYTRA